MKFIKLFTILFLVLVIVSAIQTQDSLLVAALKDNTYSLHLEGDGLKADGGEILKNAVSDYQFLLVGEQHGIVEVGQFTKALFLEAHDHDFHYLCIETDPFIAEELESMAMDEKENFRAFCKELPFTIPFYDNEEDYDFLQKVIAQKSKPGPMFWGVDQVFAAAPRFLFKKLAELAQTDEAKLLAMEYYKRGVEGVDEFLKTGNQGATLMAKLGPEDYTKLYAEFGNNPSSISSQILTGIQKTQEIYGYYFQGKQYDNNSVRARLMKKQFMEYYNEALKTNKEPKVVFKFGATHTYRGLSYYDQFDLGNLVSELAEMNGNKSLHIYFAGIKGTANSGLMGPKEFDNTNDLHPLLFEAVKDRLDNDEWILVDMRPLKYQFNRRSLNSIRDLVLGYDLYVIVPTAHPVSSF